MSYLKTSDRLIIRRALGAVFDLTFIFAALFGLWYFQPWVARDPDRGYGSGGIFLLLASIAFYFGYFVGLEGWLGTTPGKAMVSIHVESLDGLRPSPLQVLKRHLLDGVELQFFGLPAFIALAVTNPPRRLGDMWAGTRVIRDQPD